MAQLPDPQVQNLPPNAKILRTVLTDSVANLNSIPDANVDFGDLLTLNMAYTILYPVLKKHNQTEVDHNGSGG